MSENRILDISWGTILKISAAVIGFYVLYLIRDLLIWFIFAVTISILFDPIIDFLQRKRVPRGLAVAFVYLSAFGLLALAIFLTAPLFTSSFFVATGIGEESAVGAFPLLDTFLISAVTLEAVYG